jgi:hypothetical protein
MRLTRARKRLGMDRMHLHKLRIINFRAVENIEVEFDSLVSVIIGPNAIGKTTILEAVRLAKSVLAPRTQNESAQTLHSLGGTSPHMPQRLFPAALTTNPTVPTQIKCAFKIESSELAAIEQLVPKLAANLALQNIGLNFANLFQAMGYLNSPQGEEAAKGAQVQLTAELSRIKASLHLQLNLTIDYKTGQISGEFPIQQLFFSALEQALDPTQALFSYFPADRAMPTGEQPVQLGSADTSQQLESYNSQPQLKYKAASAPLLRELSVRSRDHHRSNPRQRIFRDPDEQRDRCDERDEAVGARSIE